MVDIGLQGFQGKVCVFHIIGKVIEIAITAIFENRAVQDKIYEMGKRVFIDHTAEAIAFA